MPWIKDDPISRFPFPAGPTEFCGHALFGESFKFSLQQLLTFVVDIGIDLARRSCAFAPVSNNVETHVAWMSSGIGSRVQKRPSEPGWADRFCYTRNMVLI